MPLPSDLVPVAKTAPPVQAGVPKDLIPILPNQVRTINTPGTGANVLANQQIEKAQQPLGDMQMAKADLANIRPDERAFLQQNEHRLTPELFQHSLDVFSNKDANFFTKNEYYYDRNGIPQQIKFGETAPDYAHVQSTWGGQTEAENDTWLTTLGKSAWNGFFDIAKLPATLIDLGYNLFGGKNSTDFSNWIRTSVEQNEFNTSSKSKESFLAGADKNGKPFDTIAEALKPENFSFNSQNISSAIGGAVGMISQMLLLGGGGGSATAVEGAGELSLSEKLLPFAKKTGANTLYMLNSTYDEATRSGLQGHEKFAVSLISAIGQGIIMSKLFPELPVGAIEKEVQQTISKSAVDAFVKASDGKITSEALQAAYKETLIKSAEVLPKAVAKISPKIKSMLQTGSAMVANHAFDNAVLSFDAHLTGRTDDNAVFSPKAFSEYFNSFVSGSAMGLVGGVLHKSPEEQNDTQSKMAYAYIREGREAELIHNLNGLLSNQQLTPEQHTDAIARVNGYKRYATETTDVKLNDEERENVFNNIFKDEKVQQHIKTLEQDTVTTEAIKQAKLKVLKAESRGYIDEIAKTMGKKQSSVETAKTADKTGTDLPTVDSVEPVINGQKETKTQRRNRIVNKVIDLNPEFIHREPKTQNADEKSMTEYLAGRDTIRNDATIAQKRIDQGTADTHDYIEVERFKARKAIKVGDVLTVRRFILDKGKKYNIEGRTGGAGENQQERAHLLVAFNENGDQVGGIKYGVSEANKNDSLIHKLMDAGEDVRLVVTANDKQGTIEYRIISKPKGLNETSDQIKLKHNTPVEINSEGVSTPRQIHEGITKALSKRTSRELLNKTTKMPVVEKPAETPQEAEHAKMVLESQQNQAPPKPVLEKSTASEADVKSGIVHRSKDDKYRVVKTPEGLKVFDKKSKEPSKTTSSRIIKEYLRTFDFEKGASAFDGVPKGTVPANDMDAFIVEHSQKPSELIDTYTRIKSENPVIKGDYIEETIAHGIGKVKRESYISFGDKNNISQAKAKIYFSNDGESIDTLAQSLSEDSGVEITPQDIVDFIDKYHYGREQYLREQKNPVLKQLSDRFSDIAGFDLNTRAVEAYRDQQLANYKIDKADLQKEFETYEQAKQEYEKAIAEGRIQEQTNSSDVPQENGDGGSSEKKSESEKIKNEIEKNREQELHEKTFFLSDGSHRYLIEKDINNKYDSQLTKLANDTGDINYIKEDIENRRNKELRSTLFYLSEGSDKYIKELEINKKYNDEIAEVEKRLTNKLSSEKNGTIKFQSSDSTEKLASDDPELQQHISDRLSELFPDVVPFSDPDQFQLFLDRNFPGNKLDLSKLGAAVKNAVYINPNRAVQSTAIHEYSHIYWDSLPENDPLKKDLIKFFGDEESAVTAIGKLGVKSEKIRFSGTRLQKFLDLARKFWAKVKNLFGQANADDVTRLFAEKVMSEGINKSSSNSGSLKFQSEQTTPQQDKVLSQLHGIASHFDYNASEHTYTLKGTDTLYKPVNDILEGDKKYSYKGKSNPESSQRGKDLHYIAEALVRGENFDDALDSTELKITPSAKEEFRTQINKTIETLRAKGSVLPETIFASSYFKTAGRPDLPIVDKDGTLHIYDFKTSTMSTEDNALYEKGYGQKVAKKDRDGAQLAMYAKLAEHGDATMGVDPMKIGDSGIIPIRLTLDKDGTITKITVEKTVEVPYDNYRDEARRLLSKQHKDQGEVDSKEFKHAGAKNKSQYMKFHGIDERVLEDELTNLGDTDEDNTRAEEIYNTLETAQKQFEKYKEDFQKVKNLEDADLSKYSYDELIDAINTINSYDSLLHNIAMKEIQVEAGRRMTEMETERLAKKGVKAGPEKDLNAPDVFFKALSDVSEQLPALQARIRDYFGARQAEETEHADVDRQAKKLFMDVIREKEKNTGILTKLGKTFAKSDLSKYSENLFAKKADEEGPAILKDWKDLSNNLSANERSLLKFMGEKMSEFEQKQALSERGHWDGFYAEISPNFWESYHRHGFLQALASKFREDQPEELGLMGVKIKIGNEEKALTYDEAEKLITEAGKKNILTKAAAALKLTRAHAEAKKELDKYIAKNAGTESAIRIRGAASRYTLNDNGEMVSKFNWKRPAGKEVSYDVYRSFMSYMTDAIHVKHMQPLLPELMAMQEYYKSRGENKNTENFIKHWIDGDIFGKEFVGQFGRGVDSGIKFLQAWTYYNVMPFNLTLGKFNLTTGKFNQIRAEGIKKFAIGEKRYFSNFRNNQAMLQHYTIVDPLTKGPEKYNAHNIWEATSNIFVSGGENSIRGAAFFSNLTQAEHKAMQENFDSNGNIIDKSKDIAPGRIAQLKKQTEDIQGKYAFADKRMYKHYVGLRSAMMFKGWMIDFVKERFGKEYTDIYGVTHKGSYRSIPYTFRDLKTMMQNINGDDVNAVNNRKNVREALIFATMFGIYVTTFGSKEDKKKGAWVLTMANDLLGPMNLSRTKNTIAKPFPIMGTVSNFVDALQGLTEFYTRDSKFGKKGDWMFPGKLLTVLPYNNVVKGAVSEIANPDYNGK